MADGLRQVAALPDPVGEISDLKYRPTGIQVGRMRVPLGVVGIIYESRPNVTADAAALCLKSGNAAILRGGSEAMRSNQAIAACMHEGLAAAGLPEDAVQAIATTDRAAVGMLATMDRYVDVLVPRGGKSLIQRVADEATVPVIKHLDGVCHVFIDEHADVDMAIRIADNAKTQRYSPCNTMETLLVHERIAARVLVPLARIYAGKGVELRGDRRGARARSRDEAGERRGLDDRIPGADPRRPRRREASMRRSSTSPATARSTPMRSSPRIRQRDALPARSRFELGDGQCIDPVRRRLRVRPGRRDRDFDQQAARARARWASRA